MFMKDRRQRFAGLLAITLPIIALALVLVLPSASQANQGGSCSFYGGTVPDGTCWTDIFCNDQRQCVTSTCCCVNGGTICG
jgi:hypothetical protein